MKQRMVVTAADVQRGDEIETEHGGLRRVSCTEQLKDGTWVACLGACFALLPERLHVTRETADPMHDWTPTAWTITKEQTP